MLEISATHLFSLPTKLCFISAGNKHGFSNKSLINPEMTLYNIENLYVIYYVCGYSHTEPNFCLQP